MAYLRPQTAILAHRLAEPRRFIHVTAQIAISDGLEARVGTFTAKRGHGAWTVAA